MIDKIQVAKILKPHGLKGELKIEIFIDDIEILTTNPVYIDNKECKINNIREFQAAILIIKFDNIDSIEDAEKISNKEVFTDKSNIKMDEGEMFAFDGIGMEAFFKDTKIGTVINIINYGADDLLEIDTGEKETALYLLDKAIFNTTKKHWMLEYDPRG